MNINNIKSNADIKEFIKETVSGIASGFIRGDEGEALLTDFVKFITKTAEGKYFRRVLSQSGEGYYISVICAGDKGFYSHITKGGESIAELWEYRDPLACLRDALEAVEVYKETGVIPGAETNY